MRCRYARRAKIARYAPADTEIPQLKKVTQLKNIISFLGVKKNFCIPAQKKNPPPAVPKYKNFFALKPKFFGFKYYPTNGIAFL